MSKQASEFQEEFMARIYRGKEIFKPWGQSNSSEEQ